jgi:hypothetical protein
MAMDLVYSLAMAWKRCRWSVLAVLLAGTYASAQDVPRIDIVYPPPDGTAFDRGCARFTKTPANPAYVAEAVQRRDEFQGAWDNLGPRLMKAVLGEVGLKYPYVEMQATLTLCALGTGGTSSPLLMYAEPYVRTVNRRPMWLFAEQLFHEIMHTYTRQVYGRSPLREKYSSEPVGVLNHLHVLALEVLALRKNAMPDELKYIDALYRRPEQADYKRAWELVNDIEGHEAFIKELQALKR